MQTDSVSIPRPSSDNTSAHVCRCQICKTGCQVLSALDLHWLRLDCNLNAFLSLHQTHCCHAHSHSRVLPKSVTSPHHALLYKWQIPNAKVPPIPTQPSSRFHEGQLILTEPEFVQLRGLPGHGLEQRVTSGSSCFCVA